MFFYSLFSITDSVLSVRILKRDLLIFEYARSSPLVKEPKL